MFTGIIEALGTVLTSHGTGDSRRITIEAGELASELAPGDSIAVDGACQTVVETGRTTFSVDRFGVFDLEPVR